MFTTEIALGKRSMSCETKKTCMFLSLILVASLDVYCMFLSLILVASLDVYDRNRSGQAIDELRDEENLHVFVPDPSCQSRCLLHVFVPDPSCQSRCLRPKSLCASDRWAARRRKPACFCFVLSKVAWSAPHTRVRAFVRKCAWKQKLCSCEWKRKERNLILETRGLRAESERDRARGKIYYKIPTNAKAYKAMACQNQEVQVLREKMSHAGKCCISSQWIN